MDVNSVWLQGLTFNSQTALKSCLETMGFLNIGYSMWWKMWNVLLTQIQYWCVSCGAFYPITVTGDWMRDKNTLEIKPSLQHSEDIFLTCLVLFQCHPHGSDLQVDIAQHLLGLGNASLDYKLRDDDWQVCVEAWTTHDAFQIRYVATYTLNAVMWYSLFLVLLRSVTATMCTILTMYMHYTL